MKKRGQKFSSIKPWKVLNKELILFRIDFALLYLNQNFQYNLVKFLQKDNSKINICQRKYEKLLSEVLRLNHFQRSVPEGEGDSLYKSSFSNYGSTSVNYDSTLINHNSTLINYEIADLKAQVSVKLAEARLLRIEIKGFADMVENLARGLHSDNPEKLVEYGIK